MKNTLTTLAILLFLVISSIGFAQNKVAVLPPDDKGDTGFGDVMREMLSTGISKSNLYKPIVQAEVDKVLKESNYSIVDVGDENQITKIGKLLSAEFMCVSMIKKMGDNYFITAKLINSITGAIEFQEYLTTEKGDKDLFKKIDNLAKMLSNADAFFSNIADAANDNMVIIQIDFLDYKVMPKDFDNKMNYKNAKEACSDMSAYGYDDWFLPTKDQLNGIYLNKEKLSGFSPELYWSVSAVGGQASAQDFETGVQQNVSKSTELKVRCIKMVYDKIPSNL